MGYKVTARLRIDLSEFGEDQNGNSFFAEMQHPKLLTFDQQLELAKIAPAQKKKPEYGGEPEQSEEEKLKAIEQTAKMAEFVQSFLKAWNLIDIDTEETVPVDAANAFKRIPSEVVQKIFTEFTKVMGQKSEETKN